MHTDRARVKSRRGAVLVEFAMIAIAFYLLLAGTFEIGRMVFASQMVQNAARVGARELALIPLPATWKFDQALGINPPLATLGSGSAEEANVLAVRDTVYDIGLTAHDISSFVNAEDEAGLRAEIATWPTLNQMLVPLMIREQLGARTILRYPGAIIAAPQLDRPGSDGLIVMVPVVTSRGAGGVEVIEWRHVVEEIRAVPADPASGPFSMIPTPPQTQQGLVALRINYPFQAGMLTAFRDEVPGDPIVNDPVLANDGGVTVAASSISLPGAPVSASTEGVNAGPYGLGTLYALNQEVRPFRRVLSAQSIFRREVFK